MSWIWTGRDRPPRPWRGWDAGFLRAERPRRRREPVDWLQLGTGFGLGGVLAGAIWLFWLLLTLD